MYVYLCNIFIARWDWLGWFKTTGSPQSGCVGLHWSEKEEKEKKK